MKINFDFYRGKEKPELLMLVRAYRHKLGDDAELLEALKGALQEDDWDAIQAPPEPSTTGSTLAPPE